MYHMLFSHVRKGPNLNIHMHACIAHETTKRIIRGKEKILREGNRIRNGDYLWEGREPTSVVSGRAEGEDKLE